MVAECFMNLECKYLWEKEIVQGDDHVMICLEVVGGHIEKDYIEDMFLTAILRTGTKNDYLFR